MTQTVLIHGATGETGREIVDGLMEDGGFELAALVRPQSRETQPTKALKLRGISIIVCDVVSQSVEEISELVAGYDTIISAVSVTAQLDQLKLVDAAAKAGTKRFIPCGFTSVSPPGGVQTITRAEKEKIHERIWYHHLPYTIIDSGFWYQISFPTLPSGKVDYAFMGEKENTIYADGNAPNLMLDKRDIGRFTARIIKDSRTLNKRVFLHAEVMTQNEIWATMERMSGERIEGQHATPDGLIAKMHAARAAHKANPGDPRTRFAVFSSEYIVSKYVRLDNTPETARYLGYLDTRELYPDFEPIKFSAFIEELLDGRVKKLYQDRFLFLRKNE